MVPAVFTSICACYAPDAVHIGSDHRRVVAKVRCSLSWPALPARSSKKSGKMDKQAYCNILDQLLSGSNFDGTSANQNVAACEEAMRTAAASAQVFPEYVAEHSRSEDLNTLRRLVGRKRLHKQDQWLTQQGRADQQKRISKDMQKLMRKHLQNKNLERTSVMLNTLRGLRDIAGIKGMRPTQGIESI